MAAPASPQFLVDFNNAIQRLNGITTTAERDSVRLNTERQNFTRDARARLETMSKAVAELNKRVTEFVSELSRIRKEVGDNEATIQRNLAIIDRLNGELDALRAQGSRLAPGAAPVIREGYADIQRLQAENQALRDLNGILERDIRQATPLLGRIADVFGQINANPIPTVELLTEMDRLNREIEAILALLPGARSGGPPPTPPGSGTGGLFSSLFGSSTPNPVNNGPRFSDLGVRASMGTPLTATPRQGITTPSSFFPADLNNQLRQSPPASSYLEGGNWKKMKKQKGGYIYNPSSKHTFKSPRRTTSKSTKRSKRSKSTKRSTSSKSSSRRRSKRVKI